MKPAPFDLCQPTRVDEAVAALSSSESARVLAGGQSLIPAMNFRLTDVSLLVDIGRVEGLDSVSVDPDGVTVGATATQSRVLADDAAARVVPGLREALRHVGHLQIRNRGTVCGSLAHADPAAELPALAVAADAVIGVQGPQGSRRIDAADFFVGPFWTALSEGEMVTEVRFSAPPSNSRTSNSTAGNSRTSNSTAIVDEICRRAGDFAVAGLVAIIEADAGAIRSARLVGFGVGGTPTRLAAAEAALAGWAPDGLTGEIVDAVHADTADAFDDIHATTWYRQEAVTALTLRAARGAVASKRPSS